jgi:hypothetical protein
MVGGSLRVLRLFPPTKTDRHDIAEILLKVAFNTIKSIKLNRVKVSVSKDLHLYHVRVHLNQF